MSTGGMRRLTVDPYLSNERAIRAWEKAGFQPVGKQEPDHEHAAPWLLMAFDWTGPGLLDASDDGRNR
jgi:RimJ/RimL family protein N-acetyltransferase